MRLQNWQVRFEEFCSERRRMPFRWGTNDCMTFAGACIHALTGTDLVSCFQEYSTKEEADQILSKHGGLQELTTKCLGQPVDSMLAVPGDIVLLAMEDETRCLGVFTGAACIGPGKRGTIVVSRDRAVLAWNI